MTVSNADSLIQLNRLTIAGRRFLFCLGKHFSACVPIKNFLSSDYYLISHRAEHAGWNKLVTF